MMNMPEEERAYKGSFHEMLDGIAERVTPIERVALDRTCAEAAVPGAPKAPRREAVT